MDDTQQDLQDNLDCTLTREAVEEEKVEFVHQPRQVQYVDCQNLLVEDSLLPEHRIRVSDVVLKE